MSNLRKEMDLTLTPLEKEKLFAAQQCVKDQNSQFWRRTVIRCLFA
jgi:hypothetical protein